MHSTGCYIGGDDEKTNFLVIDSLKKNRLPRPIFAKNLAETTKKHRNSVVCPVYLCFLAA